MSLWSDTPAWRRRPSRYYGRSVPEHLANRVVTLDEIRPYLHTPDRCMTPCSAHAPSNHAMSEWPLYLPDIWVFERVCPHGRRHPDPDSMQFLDPDGAEGLRDHECDGCCA